MSKMTRNGIALVAMLLAVCVAHAVPQYATGEDRGPSELLSVRFRNPAHYPADAVKNRHEGMVVMLLLINPQAEIIERTVMKSSGWPELDQAALDASEHWDGAFQPGIKNGQPLAHYARVTVVFQLPPLKKQP